MNTLPAKTRHRPIIRVFVSSTFSDLIHERNALQQQAWPVLERLCQRRGFQFQAIDLRWGVSTEAGLDHRTMRICFEELHRSQEVSPEPNFLILLGNRYGWRPLPEAISVKQFQKLEVAAAVIDSNPKRERGTSSAFVLEHWYRRDDNNLPPVHLLRSRIGTDCERDKAAWERIEVILWEIINRAYPPGTFNGERFQEPPMPTEDRFGQPEFPEIVRFQASATEQEIWGGALAVEHPEQHVLACFRQITNLTDFRTPEFDADSIRDFVSVTDHHINNDLCEWQEQLKTELGKRLETDPVRSPKESHCFSLNGAELHESVLESSRTGQPESRWDIHLSDEYETNLQMLCNWVIDRFSTIINRQMDAYLRGPDSDASPTDQPLTQPSPQRALDIERQEHERFGEERGSALSFVGRGDHLTKIQKYVEGDSPWPLVIHGASGCGKTALMARAAQQVAELPICRDNKPIVRFIGVTPRSSDLRSLLRSLCQELRQRTPIEGPLPSDIRELIDEFRKQLQAATAERPVVLFLDALDQLAESDNGRQLFWIPFGQLPSHVKIVA
ncbi:MAG: AAA family ATPase, partial [Candidatus Saccharimonas sp.]|nr:AAA family ATPase [Planctomycetaceae bacterium]